MSVLQIGEASVQLGVSLLDQWNPGLASRARTGEIERPPAFARSLVIEVLVKLVELFFNPFQLLVFGEIRENHAKVNVKDGQRSAILESIQEEHTRR